MGSPDFAVPSLDALRESGRYDPALVVSQPDRPRGRGRKLMPTAVRARALEYGIPTDVMTRKTYADVVNRIAELEPDVVVVVAFGIIIKKDLLEMPRLGCVNVHASLLPRHRGVSPIQAAILAGDDATGCTTMRIDEGIDTGDVLLVEETDLRPDDTAGGLSDRLSGLGAHLLIRTIDGLMDGSVTPRPQEDEGATYTRKIKKDDGAIDWTRAAIDVDRQIRAMTPWPSAYTHVRGSRLIVTQGRVSDTAPSDTSAVPGSVLAASPLTVVCGDGALEIVRLKPEGRRSMDAAAYLAGHPLEPGATMGDT
jgi:methionyl-tRNA formyltransferase